MKELPSLPQRRLAASGTHERKMCHPFDPVIKVPTYFAPWYLPNLGIDIILPLPPFLFRQL